jgi:hypothetical protein
MLGGTVEGKRVLRELVVDVDDDEATIARNLRTTPDRHDGPKYQGHDDKRPHSHPPECRV